MVWYCYHYYHRRRWSGSFKIHFSLRRMRTTWAVSRVGRNSPPVSFLAVVSEPIVHQSRDLRRCPADGRVACGADIYIFCSQDTRDLRVNRWELKCWSQAIFVGLRTLNDSDLVGREVYRGDKENCSLNGSRWIAEDGTVSVAGRDELLRSRLGWTIVAFGMRFWSW